MKLQTIQQNLERLGYMVHSFQTKEEASDYIAESVQNTTVGIGGSLSVQEMGLFDKLQNAGNQIYWLMHPQDGMSANEARAASHHTKVYISSVNGAAETGELINIDNTGNRVSDTLYGHDTVYLIIGKNKIEPTYEKAFWRARNIAGPKNAQRMGINTPCARNGDKCYNCNSPERICRALTVLWECPVGCEYDIILVNEDLGN